ncbi:MAG: efflux RND transporter periplasmic adaptor subunit [Proteobacteria bacterium]|nr:efflux RND transporter periplasmic adaptor subunit [Pseudomonadota bacterium]
MKIFFSTLILLTVNTQSVAQWYTTKHEPVPNYRYLNGEVEAVNKATVSAQTAGRVQKINYDVDAFVAKDSIIVEFTNSEQSAALNQANENAKAVRIAYEQAGRDYARIKDIYKKKLVAKSQLDQALSSRNALQAKYKAAQAAVVAAKKQKEYTIIRAPYDGIVTQRFVEIGEVVNPGSPIMEGLSLNQLRVVTHIPEKIISSVKAYSDVKVTLDDFQIEVINMTIFSYADRASRTFKARIDVDIKEGQLFPGMTVKVAFKVGEKQAILVPHDAVIHRSELTMVTVKKGDEKILRHVKPGSFYGQMLEIISGLNANEEILINPLSTLSLDKTGN